MDSANSWASYSAFMGHDTGAGTKYISPSDALMSPCTAKLGLLKGKKFAKIAGGGRAGAGSGVGGVRRLFGGRVMVREEDEKKKVGAMGDQEMEDVDTVEKGKNEDVEMEMEKN